MLIVTLRAKGKLKEILQKQTTNPEVGIRVISGHSMPNHIDLVLDKKRRSSIGKRRGYKGTAYTV